MKKDSLWHLLWLLIPLGLVLMALGALLLPTLTRNGGDSICASEPARLGSPALPATVSHALQDLFEERLISSVEDAVDAVSRVGWVLDPEDDYRLEYWISFGEGRSMITAGFEVICISPDIEVVWRYDGLQTVLNE